MLFGLEARYSARASSASTRPALRRASGARYSSRTSSGAHSSPAFEMGRGQALQAHERLLAPDTPHDRLRAAPALQAHGKPPPATAIPLEPPVGEQVSREQRNLLRQICIDFESGAEHSGGIMTWMRQVLDVFERVGWVHKRHLSNDQASILQHSSVTKEGAVAYVRTHVRCTYVLRYGPEQKVEFTYNTFSPYVLFRRPSVYVQPSTYSV